MWNRYFCTYCEYLCNFPHIITFLIYKMRPHKVTFSADYLYVFHVLCLLNIFTSQSFPIFLSWAVSSLLSSLCFYVVNSEGIQTLTWKGMERPTLLCAASTYYSNLKTGYISRISYLLAENGHADNRTIEDSFC